MNRRKTKCSMEEDIPMFHGPVFGKSVASDRISASPVAGIKKAVQHKQARKELDNRIYQLGYNQGYIQGSKDVSTLTKAIKRLPKK